MKKSSNKNTWIWLIAVGSLLCITNIILSCVFRGTEGTNIFTAVSGWVSGIATIILGVIAVVQNKQYKEENDRFLLKQNEENSKFVESQKDISWRNAQFQLFTLYLSTLSKHFETFTEYNLGKIHNDILALGTKVESYAKIIYEKNALTAELLALKNFLLSSRYCYFEKEELFNSCVEYLEQVSHYFEDNYYKRPDWYCDTFREKHKTEEAKKDYQMLKEKYQQVRKLQNNFIGKLAKHIYKLNDFVAGVFYMSSDELKTMLENSNRDYNTWLEKTRNQKEQNQ